MVKLVWRNTCEVRNCRCLPTGNRSRDQCDGSIQSARSVPDSWLKIKYPRELEAVEELTDFDDNPFPPSDTIDPDDQVPFPGRSVFYQK